MKLWISLAVIAVMAVIIVNLGNNSNSDGQSLAAVEKLEEIKITKVQATPIHLVHKTAAVVHAKVAAPPVAEVQEEAILPTWTPPAHAEANSMLELKNFQTEEKTERPLLVITYGDAPKPNLKLEHREVNTYSDSSTRPATGTVASGDE